MTRRSNTTSRRPGLLAAALLVATACGPDVPRDADGNPARDVVLILIDTLRPDHLPFYGYETRETAPFLSSLAEDSVVFERAFSTSSWTAPSTASVFTSLYPPQHGVVEGFFAHRRRKDEVEQKGSSEISVNRLPKTVRTLPAFFQEAGYRTLGLAANVNIGEEIGFDRGFDRFERVRAFDNPKDASAEEIETRLHEWLPERGDHPTFLYLHFNDVHYPYARRRPWYERQRVEIEDDKAGYDAEIRYVDEALRRIFERYRFHEDAIVMVVSDHGQEFLEHGRKGHKTTLYRELMQVVMMLHVPGLEPRRETTNVSLIDVLPTLLDLADVERRGDWEGTSLVPWLEGDEQAARSLAERTIFGHRVELGDEPIHLFAALRDEWKLIQTNEGGGVSHELFDFVADPLEARDLEDEHPERVRALMEKLLEFQAYEPKGAGEVYRYELSREKLEELEKLGYVHDADEG